MTDKAKQAKEHAQAYRTGAEDDTENGTTRKAAEQEPARRTPGDLDQWESLANQRIEEAMRTGAFDNLPGQGKPLRAEDPFEPSEQRMANKLLRNNDLAPGWIGERKRLLEAIDKLRREMTAASDDKERLENWEAAMQELNRKILSFNLQVPIIHLQLLQLRLDEEVARVRQARRP